MKTKEIDFQDKCINYTGLSSGNDHQLQFISSLLLKVNLELEIIEARTLGQFLDSYLYKKLFLTISFGRGRVIYLILMTKKLNR